MQFKTILNRVEKFKSFVYGAVRFLDIAGQPTLQLDIHERQNSWALCSVCEQPAASYDRQQEQRFEFIPLWGIKVFLLYSPRRVNCQCCGVKVEHMPRALGKRQITRNYAWYLAQWSKRMSWQEVAEAFRTTCIMCSAQWRWPWLRVVNIRICRVLNRSV